MKKAIFHFHLFKNAGTSLDAAFKDNFSNGEWVTSEFPGQPSKNRELAKEWVLNNPQAICFSSHTAMLPVPTFEDRLLLPVIFIRHPVDRIASAYAFEKKQGGDRFGAVLARNTSFKGYVESRNALGYDRQCRNFHAERFASMFGPEHGTEVERAKKAIESLPFVGLVEQFDASLKRLETWLSDEGIENLQLAAKEQNVSRNTGVPIETKIASIKEQLGDETFAQLLDSNRDDMALYEMVKARYI
jgi:hypothetical protein